MLNYPIDDCLGIGEDFVLILAIFYLTESRSKQNARVFLAQVRSKNSVDGSLTSLSAGAQGLQTTEVVTGAGVYLDLGALLNEQRNLDVAAGL